MKKRDELRDKGLLQTIVRLFNYVWQTQSWETTILLEFAKKHKAFFPAQEKNDALNLEDFSKTTQGFLEGGFIAPFPDREAAMIYISRKSEAEKIVLIIDEFPFIAAVNPSIKSILQHTIDHVWKDRNIMLVLCGSSVSFMENEVMGYKSPLYGRITDKMEIEPFDYADAAEFFHSILWKKN